MRKNRRNVRRKGCVSDLNQRMRNCKMRQKKNEESNCMITRIVTERKGVFWSRFGLKIVVRSPSAPDLCRT